MDNQNNMFINTEMGSSNSGSSNVNGNLNAVFPNQMATNNSGVVNNNSNMSGISTGGNTLSFSMPSVNDSTSNGVVNAVNQNNNSGSYTFVNPNITGVIPNADVNSTPNFGAQDNVSSVINNGLGNNVVSNDSVGSLGFALEDSNNLSSQSNNLVNNGMSLDNNVLLNRNNGLVNENASNSLVSSMSMEEIGSVTNNVNNNSEEKVVSVKKYLGHILLFSIPLVGFIMLFVKAFGKNDDKNISNFAKAQLILSGIFCGGFIILFILVMIFGVALY